MSVFNEVYAEQYDGFYTSKNYKGECDLVEKIISKFILNKELAILDIGCGTGGHSIEMAQRGYSVTGVDLSQPMLDLAAKKSIMLPHKQRPNWICGDARSVDTGCTYDVAIMMFAVSGYLTDNNDVLNCLRNIRSQLKTGALLICDFWSGPAVIAAPPVDRIREVQTPNGKVIRVSSTTLDIEKHTAEITFKLWTIANDKFVDEVREIHHLRYFFPQEFSLYLSSAGFKLESISEFPYTDKPISNTSWNALAIAVAV